VTRSRTIPFLEALFAVTVWGASFIATKVALRDVSPVTVVWLRFAMGVVILGVAVVLRKEFFRVDAVESAEAFPGMDQDQVARRQFAWPARMEWGYFTLLGFLGVTFHQWLQSTALMTSRASTTAWIVATTPVFMALLGWLALREKLGWLQVGGILLAALGVPLVVTDGNLASLRLGQFGQPGDVLVLVSSLNWAVFSVLSRRGLASHPATRMMFYVMTLGWAFTSILFFAGPGLREVPQLTFDGWLGVAFLGIFCSGLAYIAWYDALQALPAAQIGAFLYLEPPIAVVVAGLILAEAITWAALLGGGIILIGVWLVNRKRG
jgi:drug/metabolite transporter (DMT)-like permease